MQLFPENWDITTIVGIIGGVLGTINTILLVKQYRFEKRKARKSDLQSLPNFDVFFVFSDKIRNNDVTLHTDANIDDVPFDTVEMQLNVIGGIASNLKCDVIPVIQVAFYGMSNSTFPISIFLIATGFFDLGTSPKGDGKYYKYAKGNLYNLYRLSSAINAMLKTMYPNDLVFAVTTPHYYSSISYYDSFKEPHSYYLHNNHPISEDAFKKATDTSAFDGYVDFYGNFVEDRLIRLIIDRVFPENN